MRILPNNVAVTGKTHHAQWCETQGLIHDRWFADQIVSHLSPGDVVIEGGAHIGSLTKAMLDAGAVVFAFEANPDAVDALHYNCKCDNLQILNYALSDNESLCGLYVDDDNAGATYCSRVGGELMTAPIDKFFLPKLPIKLIKLDIEGYELKALVGAKRVIENWHPILIIEVNKVDLIRAGSSQAELFDWLRSHQYSFNIIQPDRVQDDDQYDIVAIHQK